MTLPAGEHLGAYEILAAIGAGGMGEVYRARDTRLGREVAIKLLKPGADQWLVDRFLREAKIASSLNHPNIVTVFDAGETDQGFFIAMELVKGHTIRDLIRSPRPLGEVVSLVRQIAEALAVAHHAGLVHRDVKPENLMVRDDGYAKVLDFGVTRQLATLGSTSTSDTTVETGARTILGTVKYMSPEQAAGERVGPPSDVFSLGVVFYELLTARHPFAGSSEYAVIHSILAHPVLPPSQFNVDLSKPLETLVLRMLEKDPEKRPTAPEVAAHLRTTVQDGHPPIGEPTAGAIPAVGRVKPRQQLHSAIQHVVNGHGLLFCVSGEPGIGKSTLVETFLDELGRGGERAYIARGRCSERLAGTEAYLALLDALASLMAVDEGNVGRLLQSTAPLWFSHISQAAGDDPIKSARLTNEATRGTSARLKRELLAFLVELSRRKPIVLSFDDVHWIDVATVDVLGYITKHFDGLPVLMLATYRPEELLVQKHAFLALQRELKARGQCREIALEFLSPDEVAQYVALRFPDHRLPARFIEMLSAKTEGNPLFVTEVINYLVSEKVLGRDQFSWALTRPVPDIARELPESIREMIQQKIDALDDGDRWILVAASVQGPEFDAAVVAAALGGTHADVEEQLQRLDRVHGFAHRQREHELPDGTLTLRYAFVHVLYQNALYASLTPARRAQLCRAVAQALEQFHGDRRNEIATSLAILYEAAREFSIAATYFHTAANRARELMAYREAFTLGRRALDCIRTLPDSRERRHRELQILLTLGLPATVSQGFSSSEVRAVYDRARALCQEFNETEQLGRILYGLVAFHVVRLQLDQADEAGAEIARLARDTGDEILGIHATNAAGLNAYYRGAFDTSVAHYERLTQLSDIRMRQTIRAGFGYDPLTAAHCYIAWSRWCLGYPDQANQAVEAALASARELAHLYAVALALNFASSLAVWCGDWERAAAHNDELIQISRDEGFSYFGASALFFDGMVRSRLGQMDEGLVRMREGFEALRAMEARAALRRWAGELAVALSRAGRPEEGLLNLNAEIEATTSDRFWAAELLRVKGELLIEQDPRADAEAEQCFQTAFEIARQQKARSLELRLAISLARLLRSRGEVRQADAQLAPVYGWFTEGFTTADLQDARRLLAVTETEST